MNIQSDDMAPWKPKIDKISPTGHLRVPPIMIISFLAKSLKQVQKLFGNAVDFNTLIMTKN